MDDDKAKILIEVLRDQTANISEKDDAAMDLSQLDYPEVIKALLDKGADSCEDPVVLNSCGESLGEIWARNNVFDKIAYESLQPITQKAVLLIIKSKKPNWKNLCGM